MATIAIAALLMLVSAAPAAAQDDGWRFGGFADLAYLFDTNRPANHETRSRGTAWRVNEPALNMAGVSIATDRRRPWRAELIVHAGRDAEKFAYSPTAPTHIARKFDEERQIPEPRVRAMLEQVLASQLVPRVAKLIEKRLGRKLEPFDIWYNGFRPRGERSEEELDALVRARFPSADAYKAEMPKLLRDLGFQPAKADYLAGKIVVDPARGSGHALGAQRRADSPHLRTRVGAGGMDYKGFNIAVYEMGHNVEQIFSLDEVDHTLLASVPNNAFTEALAFVFQNRDLELLGLAGPTEEGRALQALSDFWTAYEIGGAALVDTEMWHWMYDHPDASPAELRDAVVGIARNLWNRYYAPVFGQRDVTLLAVYAHMVNNFLYLPDYPIGRLIAIQIEEKMARSGNLGDEFERMAKTGSVTPDLWMRTATGSPVGADALLAATERALSRLER